MKYIIMASVMLVALFVMANAQDMTTKLTQPEKVAEAQLEDQIDYSKLNDAEIDKIKDINDVKAYLKLLTAQVMIKHKAKDKAKEIK